MSHRFREINAVGTILTARGEFTAAGRIASERSTLLALAARAVAAWLALSHRFREINAVGTAWLISYRCRCRWSHRFREINAVGTCKTESSVVTMPTSHRFREINAVGTGATTSARPSSRRRIASERSTLLAQADVQRSRFAEDVASLPRDQRCWHLMVSVRKIGTRPVASLPRGQRCWHAK